MLELKQNLSYQFVDGKPMAAAQAEGDGWITDDAQEPGMSGTDIQLIFVAFLDIVLSIGGGSPFFKHRSWRRLCR